MVKDVMERIETWQDKQITDFNKKFTELYLDPYARDPKNATIRLVKGDYDDIIKWLDNYGKELQVKTIFEASRIKPMIAKQIKRFSRKETK